MATRALNEVLLKRRTLWLKKHRVMKRLSHSLS